MAEENNLPWKKDWGIPKQETPLEAFQSPVDASLPWNKGWGIEEWLKSPPRPPRGFLGASSFESITQRMWQAESGGKHTDEEGNLITSPVGARGITQLMPATAKDPGFGIKPVQDESEEEYLRVGTEYAQALFKKYGGDSRKAVAAYNAGMGNVDKAVAMAEKKGGDFTKYLPKPKETIPYMDRVLGTKKGEFSG